MADLRQIVFRKAGHFHDCIAVETVLQHGTSHFEFAFMTAFLDTTLFTKLNTFSPSFLNTLLFELLCNYV